MSQGDYGGQRANMEDASMAGTLASQARLLWPKEVEILELLYRDAGEVVSRARFLDEIWGTEQFVSNRSVDTHILHLRQKLEVDPHKPQYLLTVHGVGYRLCP